MSRPGLLAALLGIALAVAPADASAQGPSDREIGDTLTVVGATALGITYGFTGLTSTVLVVVSGREEDTIAQSWIPLVGPWVMLYDSAGFNVLQLFAVTASGIIQAGATAMLIGGIVLSLENPEEDAGEDRAGPLLVPFATPDGGGLTLRGAF